MLYKGEIPPIVPWLLEREYAQHQAIDAGLPVSFRIWRDQQLWKVQGLKRQAGRKVVRMVVHPEELAAWASSAGQSISEEIRTAFAEQLWLSGVGRMRKGTRGKTHVVGAAQSASAALSARSASPL